MTNTLLNLEWVGRFSNFKKLILGFSGGLDSTVLLHALRSQSVLGCKLLAVHINHGISKNALVWQKHCEQICSETGVEFLAFSPQFNRHANIEEAARQARYAFFSTLMSKETCLVLAHHGDDQAETILLQLMRGTGVDGLSGMSSWAHWNFGRLARPLLGYSRKQLEQYARDHHLNWIEDESNDDTHFSRNFLRHKIIPLLKFKWPKVVDTLAKTANHCQQAQANLKALAYLDCPELASTGNRLHIEVLTKLDFDRLTNVLRVWIKNNHIKMPSTKIFHRIIHEVLLAKYDSMPVVSWKNIHIRRYQHFLYLEQSKHSSAHLPIDWLDFPKLLELNGPELCISADISQQGLAIPYNASIQVRFRQGGERLVWHGQTKQLKKLMQTWGIPPWIRDTIPLIFINDQLAAVPGYAISDLFYLEKALPLRPCFTVQVQLA
ncbi:MAG: tRNA lysidine(34) synthetase TilS [Legionella sp.]|nr:tRNA lysidine(34) synthetase TilS [Legionella sp.]